METPGRRDEGVGGVSAFQDLIYFLFIIINNNVLLFSIYYYY